MNNLISTKIKFFRNLKAYKFVPKLTQENKVKIIEELSAALTDFKFINAENIDEEIVKYLKQNYLFNNSVNHLFLSIKKGVVVNLFNGEHLEICSTSSNLNKDFLKQIKEVESLLSNKINLAYDDNLGFLMSDITKVGSGLSVESLISLPCISEMGKIEQIKQNLNKLGYNLTETQTEFVYNLGTKCNLGLAEKTVIEDYQKVLKKLQDVETESAKLLDVGSHDEIMDKSMRSLAILNGAYLLTQEELNKLLTQLRTGLNLGFIDVSLEKINKIQALTNGGNSEFISQSELKNLAQAVKDILKGEKNV